MHADAIPTAAGKRGRNAFQNTLEVRLARGTLASEGGQTDIAENCRHLRACHAQDRIPAASHTQTRSTSSLSANCPRAECAEPGIDGAVAVHYTTQNGRHVTAEAVLPPAAKQANGTSSTAGSLVRSASAASKRQAPPRVGGATKVQLSCPTAERQDLHTKQRTGD